MIRDKGASWAYCATYLTRARAGALYQKERIIVDGGLVFVSVSALGVVGVRGGTR